MSKAFWAAHSIKGQEDPPIKPGLVARLKGLESVLDENTTAQDAEHASLGYVRQLALRETGDANLSDDQVRKAKRKTREMRFKARQHKGEMLRDIPTRKEKIT